MTRWVPLMLVPLAVGCPESCIRQAPPPSQVQRQVVLEAATKLNAVSHTAPHPQHPGKGTFDSEIAFLGYDTDPTQPLAGQPVAVTFYFQALKDVHRDWQVFVHIDARGRQERVNGDHWPADGAFHTDAWRAGDYIADRFSFAVPADQAKGQLDLWAGFYSGEERLPISNPAECTNDGNNRLLAGTLQIE